MSPVSAFPMRVEANTMATPPGADASSPTRSLTKSEEALLQGENSVIEL